MYINMKGRTMKKIVVRLTEVSADDWFSKLDKKQQAEYIKAHPNSKYAKKANKSKPEAKKTNDVKKTAKDLVTKVASKKSPLLMTDLWRLNLRSN